MAAQKQKQATDYHQLFQLLGNQQCTLLNQMVAFQVQTNGHLWEQVTKSIVQEGAEGRTGEG